MSHLENLNLYCTEDTINNLYGNYLKSFGIESDLSITNEKGKCVGKIIFECKTSKYKLGYIIQFDSSKIKWRSVHLNGNFTFCIVDQYWCKEYSPSPRIDVPVEVYDEKTNSLITVIQKMTFSQFLKRRLYMFYSKYAHKYVAAYNNFYELKSKQNQYYYCINATVRNYLVKQEDLKKFISLVNHEKRRIKTEWNELLNQAIRNDQSIAMMNKLYNENEKVKDSTNVIKIRKTS
jgi:hypothetical protein